MTTIKHEALIWAKARKRGVLRYHVYLFFIVIFLSWIVWGFTDSGSPGLPWPLLLSVLWILILVVHVITYRLALMKLKLIEKEFNKLNKQD